MNGVGAGQWSARWGRSPGVLGVVAVLLAVFGVWAVQKAHAVQDDPAVRNTALTDGAATSEVKGAVADIIGKVFSYDYTDGARTDAAARASLTGPAVRQYETVFGPVRGEAPRQRTVLSTRVTDSAVTLLRGDRARLLVFADQRTTRTTDGRSTSAAAMLAVDAVRRDGRWTISGIDPFTGR
ncbi:hypothetical protein [Actinomadura fibrosa]|uniref:Mce-associated membrane protein n=1 Tax=Actinomadura fibrosa TaxID=111802 RepID=A0ABW2XDG1_9ACTN|nr:hypothetical protein [Actinomadura fibrosa]